MEPHTSVFGVVVVVAVVFSILAIPGAVAGYYLLDRFERGDTGAWLGFLLGPMGIFIAWILRDNELRDRELVERRLLAEGTPADEALSRAWDSADERERRRRHQKPAQTARDHRPVLR